MTRYSELYDAEQEAHRKTRARLAVADDFIQSFREFLRLKRLRGEFMEWLLAKHLGEPEAKKLLEKIAAEAAAKEH